MSFKIDEMMIQEVLPKNQNELLAHEALDRLSCQLHNMEVLYNGGGKGGKNFHTGLNKEARRMVRKAFNCLAEAYQLQGSND